MENSGYYIQLFSIHGLIRGSNPELGRDADTGGQVKYVLELAHALGNRKDVDQVDLVTRLIDDKTVSTDYSVPIEQLSKKVRIVRIQCGGKKYIRKELLWPHLEEFIDKSFRFIKLQNRVPDIFHGHYADAGYVAMDLAWAFDSPFISTGHSMGRNKLARLREDGLSKEKINKQYKIDRRIKAEEAIIKHADLIITSTNQEIEKQYGLYKNFKKASRFAVIPPGIDLDTFFPYYEYQLDTDAISQENKQARVALLNELHRFWTNPEKPFILALCRPDQRKNITGLIKAYGTNKDLCAIANLAVFAGIRQNIGDMEDNEKEVLTDMLLQMDKFDLYGKLAIPKKHNFVTEVPEMYRLCAESKGVFVNPALVEPFGITLIEAAASGLPIVATNDGGPVDIVANCDNGIIVDSRDPEKIAGAIRIILTDRELWETYSANGINGVQDHYSWEAHCKKTIEQIASLLPEKTKKMAIEEAKKPSFGKRLTSTIKLMITDIDNTLVGEPESMNDLLSLMEEHCDLIAWGVATGRSLELTLDAMTENSIPVPDILICSVGTEIYYGPDLRLDKGWQKHISHLWKPEDIKKVLNELSFLTFQEAEGQRSHKISFFMENKAELLDKVRNTLQENRLRCEIVFSHGQFLDILPHRASKGKAIRYLQYKYEFTKENVMVAGDSGNDEDMLIGNTCGLVVGNYSDELEKLKGRPKIYFSPRKYSAGIIDGLKHYGFIPYRNIYGMQTYSNTV